MSPARSITLFDRSMMAVSLVATHSLKPDQSRLRNLYRQSISRKSFFFQKALSSCARIPLLLMGASKRKSAWRGLHFFKKVTINRIAFSVTSVFLKLPERPEISLTNPSSARMSGRPGKSSLNSNQDIVTIDGEVFFWIALMEMIFFLLASESASEKTPRWRRWRSSKVNPYRFPTISSVDFLGYSRLSR